MDNNWKLTLGTLLLELSGQAIKYKQAKRKAKEVGNKAAELGAEYYKAKVPKNPNRVKARN